MHENSNSSSSMDANFAELYEIIKLDVVHLRSQWRIYSALFGTNQQRQDLLSDISRLTARTLEKTLFEATLLGIRRLTDPEKGLRRSRRNASINAFKPYFEGSEKGALLKLLSDACGKSEFARSWSDKKIAHSDLEHRSGGVVLPPASRRAVDDAINAIADVVKWIALEKFDTTLVTHPITSAEDEIKFLRHLFEGQRAIAEKERLSRDLTKAGDYTKRDSLYLYPDWLRRDEQVLDI